MYAIISDLHSNLEALTAVFEDIERLNVSRIVCLGDVIGYGPNPRECLKLVARCEFNLLGNHEEGLLFCADDFNDRAREALQWTRRELSSEAHDKEENYRLWDMFDQFLECFRTDDALFVHGSPRPGRMTREYILPNVTLEPFRLREIFESIDRRVCFAGHTHVPGVLTRSGGFQAPDAIGHAFRLGTETALVNIGSVGQPRDGDNRASYVVVDGDLVRFRRVPYDIAATQKRIREIPELSSFLATRLESGR